MTKGKEPENKWESGHYSIALFDNDGRLNYTIQKLNWTNEYEGKKLKLEIDPRSGLERPIRKLDPFSIPFLSFEELVIYRDLLTKVIDETRQSPTL